MLFRSPSTGKGKSRRPNMACLPGKATSRANLPGDRPGDPARCFLPSLGQHTALPVASSQGHPASASGGHRYSRDRGPQQCPKPQVCGLLRADHTCLRASQEQRPLHWAGGSTERPQAAHPPRLWVSKGPHQAQPKGRLWEEEAEAKTRVKGQLWGSKASPRPPPQAAMPWPPPLPPRPPPPPLSELRGCSPGATVGSHPQNSPTCLPRLRAPVKAGRLLQPGSNPRARLALWAPAPAPPPWSLRNPPNAQQQSRKCDSSREQSVLAPLSARPAEALIPGDRKSVV